MTVHDSDPCGRRLPIKLDSTSNGEFIPVPLPQKTKDEYLNNPDPSFATYGPRTRREFLAFRALQGEMP
jgi:hypothetical protein